MVQAQARPAFLEVDLTSAQGVALRRSVSEKYGPKIVEAEALRTGCFCCARHGRRDCVLSARRPSVLLPSRMHRGFISLSGSGETLEDAFVSCVGEGIDRLAQVECPTDVTAIANLAEWHIVSGPQPSPQSSRPWPNRDCPQRHRLPGSAASRSTPVHRPQRRS